MNTNNPISEVGMIATAVAFVAAATALLFVSKIDFTQATILYGVAAGLLGVNGALKAPSAQQSQVISNLAQTLASAQAAPPAVPVQTPIQPAPAHPQAIPAVSVMQPAPATANPFTDLQLDLQRHWGDTTAQPAVGQYKSGVPMSGTPLG